MSYKIDPAAIDSVIKEWNKRIVPRSDDTLKPGAKKSRRAVFKSIENRIVQANKNRIGK